MNSRRTSHIVNNIGTLYFYELKKLARRKTAWVTTLLLAAVMVYSACQSLFTDSGAVLTLTDREGSTVSQYLSMAQQEKINREGDFPLCGLTMDEDFFRQFRALSLFSGQYILTNRSDVNSYFKLIDPHFSWTYTLLQSLPDFDTAAADAEQFYASRQQLLASRWQTQGLSEEDIAYWQAMEAKIQKPFVYQNIWGARELLDSRPAFLSSALPLAAAVLLCGIFSEEKRFQTDTLIFSSRHGWFPLYFAKVLAGCTAMLTASGVILGITAAAIFLTNGIPVLDGAVQLRSLTCSLPITMGQAVLIVWGLLLLYGLFFGGVTMLLSVLTKNTTAALVVSAVLTLAQLIRLPVPAWIAAYMPDQMFDSIALLNDIRLVHFLGVTLNKVQLFFLLYGALTACLMALCWLLWRRQAR